MIRLVLLSLLLVAPASVEKGSLRLTSLPGVAVEWEGIALGETGGDGVLWIRDIPPGDYTLTLSKPGYESRSSRLTISSGETAVSLGLERLPAPPPPRRQRPAEPPRRPPPAPEPETATPDATEAAGADAEPEPVRREPAPPRAAPRPQGAESSQTTAAPQATEPPQMTRPPQAAAPPPTAQAPAPESQAAAAQAPPPESQAAAAGGASGAQGPLILVVLALSAALALVIGRAVRQRAAAKRTRTKSFRRRSSPKRLPAVPPPSGEPPGFLEDLKRREEHVDAGVPEIIEVTDVEIVDDEP